MELPTITQAKGNLGTRIIGLVEELEKEYNHEEILMSIEFYRSDTTKKISGMKLLFTSKPTYEML